MTDSVQFEERPTGSGHLIGRATLNAPRSLNALSLEMIEALDRQITDWQAREEVVAIWLEGNGGKALSAGGDVVALHGAMVKHAGLSPVRNESGTLRGQTTTSRRGRPGLGRRARR